MFGYFGLKVMNIDILTVHMQIIQHLQKPTDEEKERERLQELKEHFIQTQHKLSKSVSDNLQKEIDVLENHLQQVKDFSLLNFYLLYSIPIIEKYKEFTQRRVKIYFDSRQDTHIKQTQDEKKKLITEYLFLTHKFFQSFEFLKNVIPEEIIHQDNTSFSILDRNQNTACPSCKNSVSFEIFDNQSVCRECGVVMDAFSNQILSFKDIERVNISMKYTYDRRTHFRDCFYQFQGKQNVTIPKIIYEQITKQLLAHGIIPTNYRDLPKEMAFENVTKEHINIFLKDTKFVKHYEDSVLIFHILTGKPVPDLSYLEEDIMNDFDLLVEQYDKKFKQHTDRKNFINTQYVLYQLLKRHKYPCHKEDFNILKTIDRKYYHDEICSELFADLGWNFQPLF